MSESKNKRKSQRGKEMPKGTQDKNLVFASELINGLEATTRLIENLLDDIKDNHELIGYLKNEVEALSEQLNIIDEIIRGDLHTPSIQTKLALLEREVGDLKDKLEKHENKDKTDTVTKSTSKNERLKIWVSAIIGLITGIGSVIAAYFAGKPNFP
jgi:hypothetical protein